ncbi:MAG: hypothetical protein WAX85_00645 [Minisyncoccia bacterium]
MDIKIHTTPMKLERYSFLWSIIRLLLAAVALFIGGYPVALKIFPIPLTSSLLILCWLVSGIVSLYLVYRWNADGQKIFGKNETLDKVAFFVTVISGVNLGLVPILGTNIGMSISSNKMLFFVVGLIYLACAYHLIKRWKAHGEKIFL